MSGERPGEFPSRKYTWKHEAGGKKCPQFSCSLIKKTNKQTTLSLFWNDFLIFIFQHFY